MKKILIIITLILSTFTFAQESSLTVFSETGETFYLFLNNIRQNEYPEVNVKIDGLTSKYYQAKIIFANKNFKTLNKSYLNVVDVDNKNGEVTYKIKENRKGKLVLRFYSFTPYNDILPLNDGITVIHYNTNPMPEISSITTIQTTTTTTNGNGDNINVGVNIGGVNIGLDVNINDGNSNSTTTTTTTTTSNHIENNTIIEEVIDCYTISHSDFNSALKSIENKNFSDSKLILAKQVAKHNCLTAMQIKKIIMLFTFEDTKLEFAKYAYPFCYNPENYWKVNDAFEFESTIEELNDFIKS